MWVISSRGEYDYIIIINIIVNTSKSKTIHVNIIIICAVLNKLSSDDSVLWTKVKYFNWTCLRDWIEY